MDGWTSGGMQTLNKQACFASSIVVAEADLGDVSVLTGKVGACVGGGAPSPPSGGPYLCNQVVDLYFWTEYGSHSFPDLSRVGGRL